MYFLNLSILFLYTCYIYECFQLVALVREHVWHKALLMGFSMRLKLTLVSSINDFWLVRLVYIGVVVRFSWSVFTLVCFTRLIWYVYSCVCVCVCVGVGVFFLKIYPYSFFGPTTTIYIYIYIYIHICVCVCVCVCVWTKVMTNRNISL